MNKYEPMFLKSKKLTSNKKLALVRSDSFELFITTLLNDNEVSDTYKALFICALCGGLRISEALSLKKESFFRDANELYAEVKVLKKRKEDYRTIRIHPLANELLFSLIKNRVGNKLFNFTPRTAQRAVKSVFGCEELSCHSFRHSALSYLLFEKELSTATVAKLIHINTNVVEHYSHLNERAVLKKIF